MRFAAKDAVIKWNTVDVTANFMDDFEVGADHVTEDSKPFGVATNQVTKTGDVEYGDIPMGGMYSEGASPSPKALWDTSLATAPTAAEVPGTLDITFGANSGSPVDSISMPMFATGFKILFSRNKVHRFKVVFKKGPGAVTRT